MADFGTSFNQGMGNVAAFQQQATLEKEQQLRERVQGYNMVKSDIQNTQTALIQMAQQGKAAEAEMLLNSMVEKNVIPILDARLNHYTGMNFPPGTVEANLRMAIKNAQTPVQEATMAGQATRAGAEATQGAPLTEFQGQELAKTAPKPFEVTAGGGAFVQTSPGVATQIASMPAKPEKNPAQDLAILALEYDKATKALAKNPEDTATKIYAEALKTKLTDKQTIGDLFVPILTKVIGQKNLDPGEQKAWDMYSKLGVVQQIMGAALGTGAGGAASQEGTNPYAQMSDVELRATLGNAQGLAALNDVQRQQLRAAAAAKGIK